MKAEVLALILHISLCASLVLISLNNELSSILCLLCICFAAGQQDISLTAD